MNTRHILGLAAEAAVARWLSGSGWEVLAHRWRVPEGEIDLVCRDRGGCLVAVEVRLRTRSRTGTALESINEQRIGRLRRALLRYVRDTGAIGSLRVDLVTVVPDPGGGWRLSRFPDLRADEISGKAWPRGRRPN